MKMTSKDQIKKRGKGVRKVIDKNDEGKRRRQRKGTSVVLVDGKVRSDDAMDGYPRADLARTAAKPQTATDALISLNPDQSH